ncbi:ATP-dependent Clp protease ATP-binding subunit ClpX [Paraburkholderia aspalathi]|nr:ATP-dependent Clp protease ATP-binding subunit ClpX [Paraburkholderia aspalathi]MBK3779912.1 ATP-dependent Clp protease ATP-binding subunit ClpX [Paraburkholderia aspalathi]
MTDPLLVCGQCGNNSEKASQMLQLENGTCLCGECIDNINAFALEARAEKAKQGVAVATPVKGQTPRDIVAFLDQYIVGQDEAKKTLAIAVNNHYKRLDRAAEFDVEIDKSNVLMLGPTGTGKTLLAQTIARMLDVPFTVADATSLTQAGYVGDDVETILQRLIQAADEDIEKAERGIVFLDEIDKIAKANAGASITRDVSGEGVQQSLLKIIEGARVSVPVSGNRKNPGGQVSYIDTKKILFICAGAFVSLLDKMNKPKQERGVLGFTAAAPRDDADSREVTPEMLFEYGLIPEFVGRLPIIATLEPLDIAALERILVEPKNAVVRQMEALFAMDGATLKFEEGAVKAIAEQAHKLKTGARGARSILEKLLKDAQYNVPGMPGVTVTVKADLTVAFEMPVAMAA